MRPHKSKLIGTILVTPLLALFFFHNSACSSQDESVATDATKSEISRSIEEFKAISNSDDQVTNALLNKWSEHLQAISRFSSIDYLEAIQSLEKDYHKAISVLSSKIEETKEHRKKYSSAWVIDLTQQFGKEYIIKNRKAILDNFLAIIGRSYQHYGKEMKELIYIETMLYGSYQEYFESFIKFYEEELSNDQKMKLKTRKDAADNLLNLINEASFRQLYENEILFERMRNSRAMKYDKELFDFFKNHSLSTNFDVSKASDDLDAAIKNYENEK